MTDKINILYIIPTLTMAGAGRALAIMIESIGTAGYTHRVVSLDPAQNEAITFFKTIDAEVFSAPSHEQIVQEMNKADIVQLDWWSSPSMYRFIKSPLPATRIIVRTHIAGINPPHMITDQMVKYFDYIVPCCPRAHRSPKITSLPAQEIIDRTMMIYDYADLRRVENVKHIPQKRFTVGYLGTLSFVKMHRNFVQMSSLIRVPDVRFLVCGQGGDHVTMSQEAVQLNCAERFEFRTFDLNISELISQFDVYGYPVCEDSYAASELNIQEVMCCGIPPVVFPYGGIVDLVFNDFTGLVVRSEPEYRDAIEYLYNNPAERLRIGQNAKEYTRQIFDAKKGAAQFVSIYKKLMEKPKSVKKWDNQSILNLVGLPGNDDTQVPPSITFIESLGGERREFLISATTADQNEMLKADEKISKGSHLMKVTVDQYHEYYTSDPLLALWAGLLKHGHGDYVGAAEEFSKTLNLGLQQLRVIYYLARSLTRAGFRDMAGKVLTEFAHLDAEFPLFRDLKLELSAQSSN